MGIVNGTHANGCNFLAPPWRRELFTFKYIFYQSWKNDVRNKIKCTIHVMNQNQSNPYEFLSCVIASLEICFHRICIGYPRALSNDTHSKQHWVDRINNPSDMWSQKKNDTIHILFHPWSESHIGREHGNSNNIKKLLLHTVPAVCQLGSYLLLFLATLFANLSCFIFFYFSLWMVSEMNVIWSN